MGLLVVWSITGTLSAVHAEGPQSPNYRFDESTLGSGGMIQSSSASYRSSGAVSDLAVGEAASNNYQVVAGSQTTHEPNLTFSMNGFTSNFGSFSAAAPATATATFSISNYTAYGYVVQIAGDTLKNGTHSIDPLSSATASQTGTDQFGMNLVANTSPNSVGSNPIYEIFGIGTVAPNYGSPNQFRFVSGETIATASKSSGKTTYTITYLANVDTLTPGGQYSTHHTLIVTGTY